MASTPFRSFRSFGAFCRAKPPVGLGVPESVVESIRREEKTRILTEAEAWPLLARGRPSHGDEEKGNNVTFVRGNSQSYIAKRLARDRTDLLERVKAGELTLHAAGIEAGFIDRKVQVSLDPIKAAATLRRHFAGGRLAALMAGLGLPRRTTPRPGPGDPDRRCRASRP